MHALGLSLLSPASATVANVAAVKTHIASNVVVVVIVEELCRFVEVVEVVNVSDGALLRDLGGGRGCWPLSSIAPGKEGNRDVLGDVFKNLT